MRLVLMRKGEERRVAVVEEPNLRIIGGYCSIYELANGADALSYSDDIHLEDGDIMQIEFEGFGRPLRNPMRVDRSAQQLIRVSSL